VRQKLAIQDLTNCPEVATKLCNYFLDKREAAALAEDTTTEKLIKKKICHCEAQFTYFRKLACKPLGAKGGVTKFEVVIDNTIMAYTEKKDVE
jgi:hypothetical protein